MLSYCLKCKKNTESINPLISKTKNGGTLILSKCAICDSEKLRLLSNLHIKTPLSKIQILDVLF